MQHFERIDIAVNSAGIIQVGPMSMTTVEACATALDVILQGVYYPILGCCPKCGRDAAGT
jgi:NADP-dependent 3-hydroxy acid dehydrogenase YdfG